MSFIKPLDKRRSLTVELIIQIRDHIISGKLAPGQQLPTEQELVASADVSRTVVREAVSALKADGLVITRQGVGAFVTPNASGRPFRIRPEDMATVEEIINVLELRMAVEIEMSGAAAARRTKKQLADIQQCLDSIARDNLAGRDASDGDYKLHLAIARAAKNPQFEKFLSFLGQHLIPPHELLMKNDIEETQEEMEKRQSNLKHLIHTEHEAIVVAIAESDAEAAREATRRHLANSIKRHSQVLIEQRG